MIAKILDAKVSSFEGIDYSERKNAQGRSELLDAKNFGILDMNEKASKEDYIGYMKMVAETNTSVKNTQFHAVISTKGKDHTPEQLKDIATQYLEKMGYGKNPYLIYYHSDTKNNHVHVVSTRVDKEGNRVKDAYERVRSMNAIRDIMQINPAHVYKDDLSKAFSYAFSTDAQFKLLLENMGYQVVNQKEAYQLIKFGTVQGDVAISEVKKRLAEYSPDNSRVAQVKAIFEKYKGVHDTALVWKGNPLPGGLESKTEGKLVSPLSEFLKQRFGLELMFHSKDGKPAYGYTVIDHSNKQVYKGGQIMTINLLLEPTNNESKKEGIEATIAHAVASATGFNALRENLKSNGLYISWKGGIRIKGTDSPFFQIAPDDLKALKYQDRLSTASKYQLSTAKEQYIIASQFFVKPKDLGLNNKDLQAVHHLSEKFKSTLYNSGDVKEGLEKAGLSILSSGPDSFILDKANSILLNIDDALIPEEKAQLRDELTAIVPLIIQEGKDLDKAADNYEGADPLAAKINHFNEHENFEGVTLEDVQQIFGEIKDEKDPAASKKRKRKRS